MGLAGKSATFMRKAKLTLHHFLALVLAVSTLSAISAISPPIANSATAPATGTDPAAVCNQEVGTASTVAAARETNDCVVTFVSGSNTWTIPSGVVTFKVLVVGGGGGGGADSGSGGGGGAYYVGTFNRGSDTSRSFSVSVGTGGDPARHSVANTLGSNGSASTFSYTASDGSVTITAGGGEVGKFSGSTTAAVAGAGGSISDPTDNSTNASVSGTGYTGGAGGAGVAYNSTDSALPGTGGTNNLTDFSGAYGGGGGGGATQVNATSRPGGSGSNGGGNGGGGYEVVSGVGRASTFPVAGAANSGGGGGAGSAHGTSNLVTINTESGYTRDGKSGGSGVVKVRYAIPPNAPAISSITSGNQTLSVAFTAPTSNGATITGYEYSINSGTNWTTTSGTSSPFTISGLTNGTIYTVLLRAVNGSSTSPASTGVAGTPLANCNPTSVSSGGFTTVTFTSETKCNWSIPSGVTTADVLVVGGGGGGGTRHAGGGGGGGVVYATSYAVSGSVGIQVGSGGAGASASPSGGTSGTDSRLFQNGESTSGSTGLIAKGGGFGDFYTWTSPNKFIGRAGDGGSGGGSGVSNPFTRDLGASPWGNTDPRGYTVQSSQTQRNLNGGALSSNFSQYGNNGGGGGTDGYWGGGGGGG